MATQTRIHRPRTSWRAWFFITIILLLLIMIMVFYWPASRDISF